MSISGDDNKRILVTGATGFIGTYLCQQAESQGWLVRQVLRQSNAINSGERVVVGDLTSDTNWSNALDGIDKVIHLAARVHVMHDTAADPLAEFHRVNVEGTLNLARQAAQTGVKRFIFISSIKVNGEETFPGRPFTASDIPAPTDPYAISKLEAEEQLRQLASETRMEIVIIRPPLVYGPGVKANFLSMMQWLNTGLPLPLGAINNRRSLVSLYNLVDLILICLDHPSAANQTLLVSDNEDLSTPDLLKLIALAIGKPARLLSIPPRLLHVLITLFRKEAFSQRICSSLQVDITKTIELLDWTPPVSVDRAIQETANYFLNIA